MADGLYSNWQAGAGFNFTCAIQATGLISQEIFGILMSSRWHWRLATSFVLRRSHLLAPFSGYKSWKNSATPSGCRHCGGLGSNGTELCCWNERWRGLRAGHARDFWPAHPGCKKYGSSRFEPSGVTKNASSWKCKDEELVNMLVVLLDLKVISLYKWTTLVEILTQTGTRL